MYTVTDYSVNEKTTLLSEEQMKVYMKQFEKVLCTASDIDYIDEIGEGIIN